MLNEEHALPGAHGDTEASNRHRAILRSAVDFAIVATDRKGCVTEWNTGAERILGWSAGEMLGDTVERFFTPEDRANGRPETEMRLSLTEGRANDERWHLRKDGSRFWASGEMMPLFGDAGEHLGYLKILRDQTSQREMNERLAAADERLQTALTASGVGLWDWMVDTDLLHGDANFARLYGLDIDKTAAGLTMEKYQEFVVPDDLTDLRARIRNTFEQGADFLVEYRLAIPGQPLRWVECRGRLIHEENGAPVRFSGSAIDITQRKLAEAETRRLAAIVEQSSDFIGVAQLDGSVAWVNEAGRRLVGLPDAASAHATTIRDYFDPAEWPGIVATVFPAVMEAGHWRGELRFRHFVSGALIPVIYDVIALRDAAGEITAFATVTRDIGEQKQAEERQQVLNEELSHRMKNTLALVQAVAGQTLRGVTERDAVAAFNKRIVAIASAHDLLLQQRWSAAHMEAVAKAVLQPFDAAERVEIVGPDMLLGPRATLSLSLLLHELATNATKYGALSSPNGRVELSWRVEGEGAGAVLVVDWRERGGPPVREATRRGFGSRLVDMGLLGAGGATINLPSGGLHVEFRSLLADVQKQSS